MHTVVHHTRTQLHVAGLDSNPALGQSLISAHRRAAAAVMAQEAQPWRRRLAQLSGQISGAAAAGASTTYSAISSLTAGQVQSVVKRPAASSERHDGKLQLPICSLTSELLNCVGHRFATMLRVCELQTPSAKQGIVVGAEVARALREGAPVVALESTIISHGMPYPQNLATAQEVEAIVRQGAPQPDDGRGRIACPAVNRPLCELLRCRVRTYYDSSTCSATDALNGIAGINGLDFSGCRRPHEPAQ